MISGVHLLGKPHKILIELLQAHVIENDFNLGDLVSRFQIYS